MNRKEGFLRSCLLLAAAVLAGACTIGPGFRGPVTLETPFWDAPPRPLAIVLHDPPQGQIGRQGGDELYHAVVTDQRDEELIEVLSGCDADFDWVENACAAFLSERAFTVTSLAPDSYHMAPPGGDLPLSRLEEFAAVSGGAVLPVVDGDANADIELLLVITPEWWGIARDYLGVVPVSRHYAQFDIRMELYDLPNRMLLWSRVVSESTAIDRQWNEPPDFPKVYAALDAAMKNAGDAAVAALRDWKGTRAELVYFAKRRIKDE